MTAELRNLPHIASMAFNEPLMLEPAYARVFFCALAGQLGISSLTDAVSGAPTWIRSVKDTTWGEV